MPSPTTTFPLLEQANARDNPALSLAVERTRPRLTIRVLCACAAATTP